MTTYWQLVKQHARALRGDGCTAAPDFWYGKCCDEHDIAYRTGLTANGIQTTRAKADNQLFRCMRKNGKTPFLGTFIVPAIYWIAVRLFASKAWKIKNGH